MTEKDIIYKVYEDGKLPNPDCFCHYGWEGIGAFAFWKYANAYYDSAEVLYEKFTQSKGDYAILDGVGITIAFLYRHFVELTVKYLYIKYGVKDDLALYKKFLEKGHGLNSLWKDTKEVLKPLKERVDSSVSLTSIDHYIFEVDKFDQKEQAMRYPIKNNLKPMHEPTRLDIYNLHDRMAELFNAFETLDHEIDHQLFEDVPQDKIKSFLNKYEEFRSRVLWFLEATSQIYKQRDKGPKWMGLSDINLENSEWLQQLELIKSCSFDELIMFDTLYYTGEFIRSSQLNLPQSQDDAKMDAIKQCIINMEYDHVEFGMSRNKEIGIESKSAYAILLCLPCAVAAIDWDKPEVLDVISVVTLEGTSE